MPRPVLLLLLSLSAASCSDSEPDGPDGHERMVALLAERAGQVDDTDIYLGDFRARELRPIVAALADEDVTTEDWWKIFQLGVYELGYGREREAIEHLTRAQRLEPRMILEPTWRDSVTYRLGVAYLRMAETQNCCARNTPESCILPLRGGALHTEREGSEGAIREFTRLAERAPAGSEMHMRARWLLNLAHMTLGSYPDGVPAKHRIPPAAFQSDREFPRFENIAARLGLNEFSQSGGAIGEDFDNDGYLDLMVSNYHPGGQVRYYRNNRKGGFDERTRDAGLIGITGGLNMVQADYDNDGHVDVLVLRGAWLAEAGQQPNSLLRNLGGGRFRDVTFDAGLGDAHFPTQTAAWGDYDNDGDLDLFIGNETTPGFACPCQLFRNNGDGTFTDVAKQAGVTNDRWVKSCGWGDYDQDGFVDLVASNIHTGNRLYRNNGDGTFTDVAPELGMTLPLYSFPTWFWDYDNDGCLDIYVASYAPDIWDLATVGLGGESNAEPPRLWRGDGRGGFTDMAPATGLVRPAAPMGANFGDLDNDGFLDFYLGTGRPAYDTVMLNVMYLNEGGRRFADITVAGGFAHIQKGHAVVFFDFDHDGDQDVFEQMGGAFKGDRFYDVFYENPGFGNHWIAVQLVGVQSNRSAIGARIRVVAGGRSIYKHVNSGGSFGGNPLRQTIGLGKAKRIDQLEIKWPRTGKTQRFKNIAVDGFLRIVEGKDAVERLSLPGYRVAPADK